MTTTLPDCGNAFTGCSFPLGLETLDAFLGRTLLRFKGFRLALVAGTLRVQAEGINDGSEAEVSKTVNVSFKSGFDFDNALEIEEDDEVELVRRRRLGCTANPGGFRPL